MWPSAIAVAEGANLPLSVTNEGTAIDGGVFKYALVGDPFSGALSSLYAGSLMTWLLLVLSTQASTVLMATIRLTILV